MVGPSAGFAVVRTARKPFFPPGGPFCQGNMSLAVFRPAEGVNLEKCQVKDISYLESLRF